MRSHLRFSSVIGAFALSTVAMAPAMAAAPVSQAGANAVNLSVAGNANGSGDATATNDGTTETKSGQATPPLSVLKNQSLFNGGVLAQEATARADGTSAACSGLTGNGGSVAQIGDSSCLNPGTPLNATLGSLNLGKLIVADPNSQLAQLNDLQKTALQQLLTPLSAAVNTAVTQAQAQFGNPGLVAGFGVLEGRCTARPGSATGDATLADAAVRLNLPTGAPQSSVTLLDLPLHPKPNTHLTTNLSDVSDMILDAISANLNTSLNGVLAPLTTGVDAIKTSIVSAVRANVEKNLAPLEQNLLDITLNQQVRSGTDSIKVRALDLELLPVAQAQLGASLVSLQVGNAACGPNGERVAAAPATQAAAPAAMPTAVSAGYSTMPGAHAKQGDDSANMVVLGAFALLIASAAGFAGFRRLRG